MMDAHSFVTIRSQATTRLQANYPLPIVKARAEELFQTLQETSPRAYLAAVVLYLPDLASESGLVAALSNESPLASLLEAARFCTAALVSTAGEVPSGPPLPAPQQSSSAHQPASCIASPIQQPRGQGGSAHAAPLSVVPSLPTVFKNGGMLKVALSFPREGQELSDEQGDDFAVGFATDSEVMGSQALDNLIPNPNDKALFASQGIVGKQAASCLAMYWQELSADRAVFRSDVSDIRKGDHALLRKRLPDATVEGGRFSLKGMYKNLPAAPLVPKGTTHEPSKADKATSDALEKRQKICREQLIKLLLPAAETARRVADLLPIHDSPQSLVNSLFEAFGPGEDDQDFRALAPEQQLAAVTFQAFSAIGDAARISSDRACLAVHDSCMEDYDLQLQRVYAVSPQSNAVLDSALGRAAAAAFSPHSAVAEAKLRGDDAASIGSLGKAITSLEKILSAKGASSPYSSKKKSPPWAKDAGKGASAKQPPKPGKKTPSALEEVAGEDATPAPKKAKASKGKGGGRPAAGQQ